MLCKTPEESRAANIAYHLLAIGVVAERGAGVEYVPEAFASDGFIHCTNGLEPLVEVANLFYRMDKRDYEVLVLDVTRISSEIRYEDPDKKFPHIYGSLNTSAIIGRLLARRNENGNFLDFVSRV